MKLFIAAVSACLVGTAVARGTHSPGSHSSSQSGSSSGSHTVKAHVTKKGAYVAASRATNPNKTKRDNYSSKGNVNPATGKAGTKDPTK